MKPVLLCTVGGSHEPILRAISSVKPEYVCFFCTERDHAGQAGSDVQVVGNGSVIKANREDEKPTLPNIPTQAGLGEGVFDVTVVPADDMDGAVAKMRSATLKLLKERPNHRLVADYTGGTKTMTAALVLVALEFEEVELQLVAGARTDLNRTADGTEQAMAASVGALRLRKAMTHYLDGWRWFAYDTAAEGLETIPASIGTSGASELLVAKSLSRALALWDRFDHAGAWSMIGNFRPLVVKLYPMLVPSLQRLTREGAKREPARLFDLWLNAKRRAAQGRYDDAVARWYRLIEWTAQWQIKEHLGAQTKDFPAEELPEGMEIYPDQNGKIKVPLLKSWEIVVARLGGPCGGFFAEHRAALVNLLQVRNNSILAHGFDPVAEADWLRIDGWTEQHFLPLLRDLAKKAGLAEEINQLPDNPPTFD